MFRGGIALAIAIAVADQLSKFWILSFFAERLPASREAMVTSFFNLVLTWNRGISFGMFNGNLRWNGIVFVAMAVAVIAALLSWLRRVQSGLLAAAIGFIVGGAAGNAIDRVVRGAVVDFLDFHLGQWHPFAFNVADAAISIGVGLLILDGLLGRRSKTGEGGAKGVWS